MRRIQLGIFLNFALACDMAELFFTETHARLRTWLASWYAMFIVYASLSPFTGWREQGLSFIEMLDAPLMLTYTAFDTAINFLSYLPFGFLTVTALRARYSMLPSLILGLCLGIVLSASMEYLQMYLPARVSSNMDMLSNSTGALLGGLLAANIASWNWFVRLARWRSVFFHQGKEMDFGLALLVLWMFGQINPSLPMLGNVFIGDVARQPFALIPRIPFNGWESCAVALNLLMLGILMLTLLRASRNIVTVLPIILCAVALAKFITAAVLLKSWALLLWINSEAMLGIFFGVGLLLVLWRSRAALIVFGAVIAGAYFVIVNFVIEGKNPAAAPFIYHWHYGHLLNYNGLAQTITLIFPLLLLWHLWRIREI
jgi:VanZ family protein